MTSRIFRSLAAVAALAALVGGPAYAAVNLPALNIDKTQTTVSGLSSGGFMAVQLHVAYSATFKKGAGIVAGGPFYSAILCGLFDSAFLPRFRNCMDSAKRGSISFGPRARSEPGT